MFMSRLIRTLIFALSICFSVSAADHPPIDFGRQIRPLLSDRCYQCHGPDEQQRATELRLDDQDRSFAILDSGDTAIVPGHADASEIIRRMESTDPDYRMPPADSGKSISPNELETFKRWINSGASWGKHWAFQRPVRPTLPKVQDQTWVSNPIDRFVLRTLEARQWSAAPPADRRTLIRRATLAATGLPPTPEEVRLFLCDPSPFAYDQLVDRLLQSPRFGEHQARYWLDAARYGDTHGLHLDNERSIWRYRDWVIDAFNRNLPFDQFTIWQLAGDLLLNPTTEQLIATGFHRCNVTTSEGGAIAEEFAARYAIDRVETTAAVWMGLTAGCAVCHDHKYDPLSQREFYQLYAYFANQAEKAMDGNAQAPPPAMRAPTFLQQIKHARLVKAEAAAEQRLQQLRQRLSDDRTWEAQFAKSFQPTALAPTDYVLYHPLDNPETLSTGHVQGRLIAVPGKVAGAVAFDGASHLVHPRGPSFSRDNAFSCGAWAQIADDGELTVLACLDGSDDLRGVDLTIDDGKVCVRLLHRWPDNALRVQTTLPLRKEKWYHVFATYDGSGKASGIEIYIDGVSPDLEITHDSLTRSIKTQVPLRIGARPSGANFSGSLDEVMIFARQLGPREVKHLVGRNPLVEILAVAPERRSDERDRQLIDAYLATISEGQRANREYEAARKRRQRLEQNFPNTLILKERDAPREAHVLIRGQYDHPGEKVSPSVPAFLPPSRALEPSRLSFARWLVSDQHPLTARVVVNRIWQQYFGQGLVKTSEDFGSQGDWPSHPELLDYLATQLLAKQWDLKSLHREILTSATFRQSSIPSPRAIEEDPENRLLSHGPRFRLDAEVIRDLALSTSGLLAGEIGGPSVKPPQPAGLWQAVAYTTSNTARFAADNGDKRYRRGLYTFWKRTSPPPQMQILDAPSREVCTLRRPRTNTPGAALLLMNDDQFVEAARVLADRVWAEYDDDRDRVGGLYEICLARSPTQKEMSILLELLRANLQAFRESPRRAADLIAVGERKANHNNPIVLAAWTIVCSTVMNLDEAITQH